MQRAQLQVPVVSSPGRAHATVQPLSPRPRADASPGSAAPGSHTASIIQKPWGRESRREGRSWRSPFPLKSGTFPLSGSPVRSYNYI